MSENTAAPINQEDYQVVSSLNSRRRILIIAVGILWFVNSAIWIILIMLKIESPDSTFINLLGIFFALILIIFSAKQKYYKIITFICILAFYLASFYLTHELPGTGKPSTLLLTSSFPLIAIFLSGKRIGTIWSILYLVPLYINYFFKLVRPYNTSYDMLEVTLAVFVIVLPTYLYQDAIDKSESYINNYTQELHKSIENNKIEAEKREEAVRARDESIKEINKQKGELERINKFMVNRELAMVELKKKLDDAQNELIKYKTPVST